MFSRALLTELTIELLAPTHSVHTAELRIGRQSWRVTLTPEMRRYEFQVVPSLFTRLTVRIDSPETEIHGRKLGVGVGDIEISGGGHAPALVLLALAAATIGGYAM